MDQPEAERAKLEQPIIWQHLDLWRNVRCGARYRGQGLRATLIQKPLYIGPRIGEPEACGSLAYFPVVDHDPRSRQCRQQGHRAYVVGVSMGQKDLAQVNYANAEFRQMGLKLEDALTGQRTSID
jgi:hypothetical protein